MPMLRAGALVLACALAGGGCVAVSPRLPVPLRHEGVVVGVAGAGAVGLEWDADFSPTYGLGFGALSIARQVMADDDFSLEIDANAGAGWKDGLHEGLHLGAGLGLRSWWRQPSTALGLEFFGTGAIAADRRGRSEYAQVELRALGAWDIVGEGVWLGVRPGLIVPLASTDGVPFAMLDVPVSATIAAGGVRVGIEAGVAGPGYPTSLHGGLFAGLEW